jgi:Aldolase/RraA
VIKDGFIKELSTICEAMGNKGYLPSGIKPIASNMKICGQAYTVQTMPRDNVLLHRAYAYTKAGNVEKSIVLRRISCFSTIEGSFIYLILYTLLE